MKLRMNNSGTLTNKKSLRTLLISVSFAVGQKTFWGMGGDYHQRFVVARELADG
jgi:hypothetical protein